MKPKIQEALLKKTAKFPNTPGVYFFVDENGNILYIGKATALKSRVRSYFSGDIAKKRSPLIVKMVEEARDVRFEKTTSVLEALILEANLIKKYSPVYNSAEKDQKSWNFLVITKEAFPKILIKRERELQTESLNLQLEVFYGPFPHGNELKEALKIIRKIFPFRDKCKVNQEKPCFNRQIGLCPGVCTGEITKKEYSYILKNIRMIFGGKKPAVIHSLSAKMKELAKKKRFEEAGKIKKKIFALRHIQDVALIKKSGTESQISKFRIEAYDIAHISGTAVVGVMVVVEGGEAKKSDYRKFKLSTDKNDDIASLREVISRRLNHKEWEFPDLVVVDGSEAHIKTVRAELEKKGINIPIVSVVKNHKHKPVGIIGKYEKEHEKDILLSNNEAHRFALAYHRKIRSYFS